jgi:hypothetical protein
MIGTTLTCRSVIYVVARIYLLVMTGYCKPFTGAATGCFQVGAVGGGGCGGWSRCNRGAGHGAGRRGRRNKHRPFANNQQRQRGRGRGVGGFFPQGLPGFIPKAPEGGINPPAIFFPRVGIGHTWNFNTMYTY